MLALIRNITPYFTRSEDYQNLAVLFQETLTDPFFQKNFFRKREGTVTNDSSSKSLSPLCQGLFFLDELLYNFVFYLQGQTEAINKYYKNEHVLTTTFYLNGQKEVEITYRKGLKNGPLTFWWEDGTLREKGDFFMNEKEGLWHGFEKDGTITESRYKRGKKEGIEVIKRNNQIITRKRYENGVFIEIVDSKKKKTKKWFK